MKYTYWLRFLQVGPDLNVRYKYFSDDRYKALRLVKLWNTSELAFRWLWKMYNECSKVED